MTQFLHPCEGTKPSQGSRSRTPFDLAQGGPCGGERESSPVAKALMKRGSSLGGAALFVCPWAGS